MQLGFSETCLAHDPGRRHPESPDRLRAIRRELERYHGTEYTEPDPLDPATARAVHEDDYVERLREFCADGGGNWDPDTVAVEATWDATLASAGIAVWAADQALEGADGPDTAFALGRPPGHHAVVDDAMGFCFFNNVAIAAECALDSVERVAVIDWDVHHGNGTQDLFYDRGDVLLASIHEQGLYPGTGDADETGEGDGDGATLNVPLAPGSDDRDYQAVLDELVGPVVEAFDPGLVLVSAGFDAHRHDPISRMRVSTEGYGMLADRVREAATAAGAPVALVLEGGYSLDVLAESVATVHETFGGYEPVDPDGMVHPGVRDLIDEQRKRFGLD